MIIKYFINMKHNSLHLFRVVVSKKGESGGFGFQVAIRHDLDRCLCIMVFEINFLVPQIAMFVSRVL